MEHKARYFYPDDIEVSVVNGKRVAVIAWWKPCDWHTKGALKVALKDPFSGWEMAREAYRKRVIQAAIDEAFPQYALERAWYEEYKASVSRADFSFQDSKRYVAMKKKEQQTTCNEQK